jgi:activator of HSP90 ATPase
MLCQFTQSPCISELKVGGKHQLFGDTIQGEYVTLEENKKIQMKWKFKEWKDFGDCEVSFNGESSCDITVKITNVPEYDNFGSTVQTESLVNGWKQNIFKRMHMVFGYPLQRE